MENKTFLFIHILDGLLVFSFLNPFWVFLDICFEHQVEADDHI